MLVSLYQNPSIAEIQITAYETFMSRIVHQVTCFVELPHIV